MNEEQHALLVFKEELGEMAIELLTLQQLVSKAIRFGLDSQWNLPVNNKEAIEAEWNDILGSLKKLSKIGVELKPDVAAIEEKLLKIEKFEDISKRLGTVK